MRILPAIALWTGAALALDVAPAGAQIGERLSCQFTNFRRCTPTRECRDVAPNEGERSLILLVDFPAKSLSVLHRGATLSTLTIHRVWNEGGKRLFIVARPGTAPAPDDPPYELTGSTLSFPNDSSGSISTLACAPAP